MNIIKIEENVKNIVAKVNSEELAREDFIYELLLGYGHRPQTIGRVRSGERNLADDKVNSVFWKRQIYFQIAEEQNLYDLIDQMKDEKRVETNKIRFLIVTDFHKLLAVDTKTKDSLDIDFIELSKRCDFFSPWAGMEKKVYQGENLADVKAAEKLAKLFDEIKADNFDERAENDEEKLHHLNIFLSRLLFCYFAEDTGIFSDKQFTNAIGSHTKADGSDLSGYLKRLFSVFNESSEQRPQELPDYLSEFPYVNGGLFKDNIEVPIFTKKSRRILIECGAELDWSDINPDIFGSMFQAVVHTDQRSDMGQHYTSVPNIKKVIEPLFLNDLYEELEKNENSFTKLMELQLRLEKIKIFDPACGSGNFLIIAYKELRKFEMAILKRLQEIELERSGQFFKPFSVLQVSQFYGIEIDDFACEIAVLSLWLAEHQMNIFFQDEFGESLPLLPLKKSGNIVCDNALRMNWSQFCTKDKDSDIFILGNPPYRGKKEQTITQKKDVEHVCGFLNGYGNLDFIACWFIQATQYMYLEDNISCGFVSTNSITQGEQVGVIWPYIFEKNIEIHFAYTSFMWKNNAKNQAGVAVVIIGLRNETHKRKNDKYLFTDDDKITRKITSKINPYLTAGNDVIISRRSTPVSNLPEMCNGSMANDDGNFFKTLEEYELLSDGIKKFYKRAMGAKEFYYENKRYCLWLDESSLDEALRIDEIKETINNVRVYRNNSSRPTTRKLSSVSYRFGEVRYKPAPALLIPGLSAESREYYPIGYVGEDVIITNLAQAVYNAELWLFALLSSKINFVWIQATSGYFKKDLRYSPVLSYNNLPVPFLSKVHIEKLTDGALGILEAREQYSDKTISYLYNPQTMPKELKEAHLKNDEIVENIFRKKPFSSDEDRLEFLFVLYTKMVRID